MVPKFFGSQTDPTAAEIWIEELEKSFEICEVPDDKKVGVAVYQLKEDAYNWWREERVKIQGPLTWERFREVFFRRYYSDSTREQMVSDWLRLKQGSKTVDEYEAEFNRLLRFAGVGYREDEMMKVQKFQDGLNSELRQAVKTFELTTFHEVAHKAKVIEQSKRDCSTRHDMQAKFLGKRPSFSSSAPRFSGKSFGKSHDKSFKRSSGFQSSSKRVKFEKRPVKKEKQS